jgi:membrane protease YdiL (CAAX protease family)
MNAAAAAPAPPAVVAARLGGAFVLFALGPELARQALLASGAVAAPAAFAQAIELDFLAFGLAGAAVGGFALVHRPAPFRPLHAGLVAGSYLGVLLLWVPLLAGYLRLMHGLGQPVARQPGLDYLAAHGPAEPAYWCVAAATACGAPIAEEVLFRGYLHDLLRRWLPAWPAIGVGALLFGLLHGLAYALPIAVLGLWFGWLRERSGSLLPAVFGHALHNGAVTAVATTWPGCLDLLYPR